MHKVNSYIELKEVIGQIESVLDLTMQKNPEIAIFLGAGLLGNDIEEITTLKYRTNHYLTEALKLKEFPEIDEIEKVKAGYYKKRYIKVIEQVTRKLKLNNSNSEIEFFQNLVKFFQVKV